MNTMKVHICILLAVVLQVVCTLASELQADDRSTYNHGSVKKGGQQRQNNVPFNLCMTDPCENEGTCVPTRGFFYKCVCPRGFAGKNCENEINFCADQPCSNGGTCESYHDSFKCLCNEGFAGKNCEVNIDECNNNPCENNGFCVDGIDSFSCNCPHPYTGKTCSTRIDHCSGTPCMNGGTCTSTTTGFKCACTADYAGESCEVDVDSCTPSPCRNGATCQDLPISYKCSCSPGFTGKNCEKDIDACAKQPCRNGARCEALLNSYKCHCPVGFSGQKCGKAMTCTLPQVSANTIPSVQDEEVKQGTTVRFTCKPGNTLQTRHNSVVCQKDGTWDRSIPSCDSITCSNPPTIENGEILTIYTQYNIGDKVRYQCDTGFEFRAGISSIRCLPTGSWDTVLPVCVSITCPDPPLITNAVSVGTDRTYGADVNYTCLPGFKSSVPSAQIKCELTKDWSSTRFRCTEIDCGAPAEIPNAIINGDKYVFENYVLYQCDQGYTLTGPEQRVCQENGQWSDTDPVCSPVVCGNLTAVLNGQVVYTTMTYLSTARFACDRGFEVRGAREITCMASGRWVPDPPECAPRSCPTPQDILFGSFTSSVELIFKATVNYTCNTGYILTGTDQLTCLEDGTWSSSAPECTKITCPQTDDPAHDLNSPRPTVVKAEKPNDKFEQSEKVAFTVGLSKQLDVLLKDVVVYNTVVSNIGDTYNNTNGVFKCNIAGLYFFQIYGAANKGKELSLSLVKNKTKVVSLYSNTNQELSLAANSAVLLLEAGDEVFVEASNCGSLYGEEHHVINTFSGFLLKKVI